MNPGLRKHKQASLRIVEPMGLPDHLRSNVRELASLKSENQRKGHASALMHQVCAEADMAAKTLMLLVDQPEGTEPDNEQIKKFYSRFGFNVAQDSPCLMLRLPQKPLIVH